MTFPSSKSSLSSLCLTSHRFLALLRLSTTASLDTDHKGRSDRSCDTICVRSGSFPSGMVIVRLPPAEVGAGPIVLND